MEAACIEFGCLAAATINFQGCTSGTWNDPTKQVEVNGLEKEQAGEMRDADIFI